MTSVWFAASGSGEDGDPWDVHEVFATKELAEAYCSRPDKPRWEHPYVQEWEVEGSLLTDEEREAVKLAADFLEDEFYGCSDKCAAEHNAVATLRKLLERLA